MAIYVLLFQKEYHTTEDVLALIHWEVDDSLVNPSGIPDWQDISCTVIVRSRPMKEGCWGLTLSAEGWFLQEDGPS